MPKIPSLSLVLPDFGLNDKREVFSPATSYALSPNEAAGLQAAVQAAFPPEWSVRFLSVNTGRLADGTLAGCGLVTAKDAAAASGRTYLYRVGQDEVPIAGGTGQFELRQIAAGSTEQLGIYSNCNAMKLL